MGILELFLIGVGLSMDAFAAAVCKGLSMEKLRWRQGAVVALFFGGFQALMPLVLLLGYIGGKMIWDAFHEEDDACPASFDLKELLILAVATSIDALAVGITFAFLQVEILPAIALIGCTTFAISLAGVWIGHRFGSRFRSKATLAGGMILCLIGLKILLEHLGMI